MTALPPNNTWTSERVEQLKKLWSQGLPTVEIGELLGVTKNSVVGKVHRLNLTKRQLSSKNPPSAKESQSPKKSAPKEKEKEKEKEQQPPKEEPKIVEKAKKEHHHKTEHPDIVPRPPKKKSFAESKNIQSMLMDSLPQHELEIIENKPRDKSKIHVSIDIQAFKKSQKIKEKRKGIQLHNIKSSQCHWPIGDPDDYEFHFCGEPSISDSPYCQEHMDQAYQKNSK